MVMFGAEDKALQYEALLLQISEKIKELETIGMNMQNIKKRVEAIEVNLNKKIEEHDLVKTDNKKEVSFPDLYIDSINELKKIAEDIENNKEEYFIIAKKIELLRFSLNSNDKIDFFSMFEEGVNLLDKVEYSSTVGYQEEKKIIQDVYEVVYSLMKIEAIYNDNQDILFNKVSSNDIHSAFISQLIKKDIDNIEDRMILNRILELETKGLESNVLIDKYLFSLLALASNEKYVENLRGKFDEKFEQYQKLMQQINVEAKNVKSCESSYNSNLKMRNKALKQLAARISVFGTGVIISIFSILGTYKHLLKANREYITYSTTYDMQTGEIIPDEKYEYKKSKEIEVLEKGPWKKSKFSSSYQRKVYSYLFDSEDGIFTPEEYVKMIDNLEPDSSDVEVEKKKPADYNSLNNSYFVTMKEYGDDFQINIIGDMIVLSLLETFAIMTLTFLFYLMIFNELIWETFTDCYGSFAYFKEGTEETKIDKEKMDNALKNAKSSYDSGKKILDTIKADPSYMYFAEEYEKKFEEEWEKVQKVIKDNKSVEKVLSLK